MEVHHHPEVGKKTFKEYLLEGLMIFIAVTLGFFAESLREHIQRGSHEANYARAFAADLRVDTARINDAVELNIYDLVGLDSLQDLLLARNFTPERVLRAYKLQNNMKSPGMVLFSEGTYKQLHGTGDARLIHDSVAAAIEDYHQQVQDCQNLYTYYDVQMRRMVDVGKNLFRPQYLFGAFSRYVNASDTAIHIDKRFHHALDSMSAVKPLTFATDDPKVMDNYSSDLGFHIEIIFSYIRDTQAVRKSAVALLKLLHRYYDID